MFRTPAADENDMPAAWSCFCDAGSISPDAEKNLKGWNSLFLYFQSAASLRSCSLPLLLHSHQDIIIKDPEFILIEKRGLNDERNGNVGAE